MLILLLIAIAIAQASIASFADDKDMIDQKLALPVKLSTDKMTIQQVTTSLSEQTGVKITAADYLREREVMLRLNSVSARAALNALAELNDWKWRKSKEGVVLERNTLRLPVAPGPAFRQLQSAVPKDMRDFLKAPTPSADLTKYSNPLMDNRRSDQFKFADKLIFNLLVEDHGALLASLPPSLLDNQPLKYEQLTVVQKQQLLSQLVFHALKDLNENTMFAGDPGPYIWDPRTADLFIKGGAFLVYSSYRDALGGTSGMGFGIPIKP